MVPCVQSLDDVYPPATVAQLNAMIAETPPAPGELVQLSPDKRRVTWTDAKGTPWAIDIIPTTIDEDDFEDADEDDDEHAA